MLVIFRPCVPTQQVTFCCVDLFFDLSKASLVWCGLGWLVVAAGCGCGGGQFHLRDLARDTKATKVFDLLLLAADLLAYIPLVSYVRTYVRACVRAYTVRTYFTLFHSFVGVTSTVNDDEQLSSPHGHWLHSLSTQHSKKTTSFVANATQLLKDLGGRCLIDHPFSIHPSIYQ